MLCPGAYGSNVYNILKTVNSRFIFLADLAIPLALLFPNKISLGRISLQHQNVQKEFYAFAQQPLGASDDENYSNGQTLAELLYSNYPYIDIWQLYNESVANDDFDSYRKLNSFELGATRKLHELGKKSCVLNLGVGVCWPSDYIKYFGPLLNEADFVGFHAYGSKNDQLMNGPDQQWYARRFELVLKAASEVNARIPPIFITECTTFDPWHGFFNSNQILDDISWFSNLLYSNPHIAGIFPFQIGHPGSDFSGFDLSDQLIIDGITEWNSLHKEKEFMEFPVTFPVEVNVDREERIKLYEYLFSTMGGLNDNAAIHKYWITQTDKYLGTKGADGKWFGPPVSPEIKTKNEKHVYQVFSCGSLYCEVDVWEVKEGLPPL